MQEHFAALKSRLLAEHAAELDASRQAGAAIAQALQSQLGAATADLTAQLVRRKKCKEQLRRYGKRAAPGRSGTSLTLRPSV